MTKIGRALALYFNPTARELVVGLKVENKKLNSEVSHLKSKNDMLEKYIISNEERHVRDMAILNDKIDNLSDRVIQKDSKYDNTLKELLFEREQSKLWMGHVETLLERDPDISLLDLEELRLKKKQDDASKTN